MLTRTPARAVALALAGLALAACGSVHPGSAAVVDGRSISMKTLDETAEAYCTLTARSAAEQGATAPQNVDLRRQAITTLVSLEVAREIAQDKGVAPKSSAFQVTDQQQRQIARAFPDEDLEMLTQVIQDSQELALIALALGELSTGEKATVENEATVGEAGQREITEALADHDVEFAPRLGLDRTTKAVADSGSLSVPEVDLGESDTQLPAAQRCT